MTYTQARTEAEQRILNGARAYSLARTKPTALNARELFRLLMIARPNS